MTMSRIQLFLWDAVYNDLGQRITAGSLWTRYAMCTLSYLKN